MSNEFAAAGLTLGQLNAFVKMAGGEEVVRDVLSGRARVIIQEIIQKIEDGILEFIGTTFIPATTCKFVAKKKFVLDIGSTAKVKISCLGDNFISWFLKGDGKIEDSISEQALRYAKLRKASVDGPIITELGGEAKAETTLSEIYALMTKQGSGEKGALLHKGWWNIFYVRDQNGVLRTVFVYWCDDGWRVGASSVENPGGWHGGRRVFSRPNSRA